MTALLQAASIDFVLLIGFPAAGEELSEEDQQLKSELDMIVERLTVGDAFAGPAPLGTPLTP